MTRHMDEPKGSATTPRTPSFTNWADTPNTASAPNQVAKTVAVTTGSGRLRPATAKSFVSRTRVAAHRPMPTDSARYSATNQVNMTMARIESSADYTAAAAARWPAQS